MFNEDDQIEIESWWKSLLGVIALAIAVVGWSAVLYGLLS